MNPVFKPYESQFSTVKYPRHLIIKRDDSSNITSISINSIYVQFSVGDRVSYIDTNNHNNLVVADIVAIDYELGGTPRLIVNDGITKKQINSHFDVSGIIYIDNVELSIVEKSTALVPIKPTIIIDGIKYSTGDTVSYESGGQKIVAKISDIIKNYIKGIVENGIDPNQTYIYVDDGGYKIYNFTDKIIFNKIVSNESKLKKENPDTPLVQKQGDSGNNKYTLKNENNYRIKYAKYKSKYLLLKKII